MSKVFIGLILWLGISSLSLAQPLTHTVETGDSLFAIAERYGVSVTALRERNQLSSSLIHPGQQLVVPGAQTAARVGLQTHTVVTGESFSTLAERYGLSPDLLARANGRIATSPLTPEETLLIPPAEGQVVRLTGSDTLLSLALRYGMSPTELARVNALSNLSALAAGDHVFIPQAFAERGSLQASASPVAQTGRRQHHLWQQGLLEQAPQALALYRPAPQGYAWPLTGRLTSHYGHRNISVGGNTFHGGIDIAGATGTPIKAARDGQVVRAGWGGAYGFVVYLNHADGSQTRYAHMNQIATQVGMSVQQGDVIGFVGSTGASTGPHLHFELRLGGRAVDPLPYLKNP